MDNCEMLEKCRFMKKWGGEKELAMKGFVRMYCQGPRQATCERKKYRQANGMSPSDDMMPNGQTVVA